MGDKCNILQKTKNGHAISLEDMITLYYLDIFRYCLWHTPDTQTAEDATQETFLKTIRYFRKYIHSDKLKSYIYKVASNVCIDIWRKKGMESLPDNITYVEKGFSETEFDLDLKYMVENLPEKYREIILLRFAQDLSMREVAD